MMAGCLLDTGILAIMFITAIWANSLSLLADAKRALPMLAVEFVLLHLLRQIHRGRLTEYDYGTRKVEQFANLLAGVALLGAAAWLVIKILSRLGVEQQQPALGLAAAALTALVNLGINAALLLALWRAARGGGSLILQGQVMSRLSKTLASTCVMLAIGVNALAGPGPVGEAADLAGTAVVIVTMVGFGWRMVADALPHLLDRALGERQQAPVNRALAARFHAYDELVAVRTRTEGLHAWIEIELGFAPGRTVGEASAEADRVAEEVRREMPDARVLVVIRTTG